jgi:hypothetical protein
MESIGDYFSLGLDSTADYLILSAVIVFIVGIVSFSYNSIQINGKSRYYFILSFILFALAIFYGWNDWDVILKNIWESF